MGCVKVPWLADRKFHRISLNTLEFTIGQPRELSRKPILPKNELRGVYVDILVEGRVIVEVKATEKLHPIYEVQLLTYLRLIGKRLGLLVNFGQEYVKDGINRVVNGL